jgi:trans-aconitate methyltransferase
MRDLTPLCLLAKTYETDKGGRHMRYGGGDSSLTHEYTPIYYDLFKDRAKAVNNVIELGINSGASLRMWEEFFPHACIFGVDCAAECMVNEGRIRSFACDLGDVNQIMDLQFYLDRDFDVIIDDASHEIDHQVLTVQYWSKLLTKKGLLIIEDIAQDEYRVKALQAALPEGFTSHVAITEPMHGGNGQCEFLFVVGRK